MNVNYILSDLGQHKQLLPFTFTRPIGEIRCGISTLAEKWQSYLGKSISCHTEDYLQEKYPLTIKEDNIVINAAVFANEAIGQRIHDLSNDQVLIDTEDRVIAYRSTDIQVQIDVLQKVQLDTVADGIFSVTDIFTKNDQAIRADFARLTADRTSQPIPKGVQTILDKDIFIEEGASVQLAILNATDGPIYIGKDAQVMEGSIIRGPFALCANGVTKLGTKVYGATTVGPYSKIGGEVSNSVIFGYSNKGHEGFLGNSVLGEWCNLGADTNTSNLKNNYAEVKLWNYKNNRFVKTGLQFCGLMMGDHSKCGINTMFNTGTVIGVSANIYGAGYPRNFLPSFTWGGPQGTTIYKTKKAYEVAQVVMQRRKLTFTEVDQQILDHVYEATKSYRREE